MATVRADRHIGTFTMADPASRAHYYQAFSEAIKSAGIGWALWDWKPVFRYWDEKNNRPEPGMHEALFGHTVAERIR